ncbi:FtsX-like permease family protein [Streptomyces sp. NPDC051561]|uniref:FtsX-like permease family protein n=1 Tax=Streptomyces sp. NPDC051561 TaxID=3365658 RepID=UPI0037B3B01A
MAESAVRTRTQGTAGGGPSGGKPQRVTPVLVRWGRHHALVLCAAALAVALAATVLAALAALSEHAVEGGVRGHLASDQGAVLAVTGDHPTTSGPAGAADRARTDAAVRGAVDRTFGGVAHRTFSTLRAPSSFAAEFGVIDGSGGEREDLTVAVVSVEGVGVEGAGVDGVRATGAEEANARLVEGRWPAASGRGGVLEGALPVNLATQLGVRVGGSFGVVGEDDRPTMVRMTGSYETAGAGPALWRGVTGPFGDRDRLVFVHREAFLARKEFTRSAKDQWLAVPEHDRLGLGDIEPLSARLGAFVGSDTALSVFGEHRPPKDVRLTVDGALVSALGRLETPIAVSRAGLYIPASLLAALAAAALVLTARQLAEHRRPELALLAARGAGTPRIAGSAVAHWATVAVPAGLAAPFLAGPLLTALADTGLIPGAVPASALVPLSWALALLAVLVHGAAMLAPAVRSAGDREAVAKLRRRLGKLPGVQKAGTDVALGAVAVLAWLQLRQYRSPVGDAGLDPVLVLAPVTMTCAAALLALRLLPLIARVTEPLAARGRGLVLPLGGWQVGRRAAGNAGATLVVALALAVGALSSTSLAMLERSDHDQAVHAVGSDLSIVPDHTGGPRSDQRYAKYAALPGATAVTPVFDTPANSGQKLIALTSFNTTAGPVPTLRADLADRPTAELLAALGKDVPAHGAALDPAATRGLDGRLPLRVRLSADGPGPVRPVTLMVSVEDGDGLVHRLRATMRANGGRPQTVSVPLPTRTDERNPLRIVQLGLNMEGESVRRTYRLTIDRVPGLTGRPQWVDPDLTGRFAPRSGALCPGTAPETSAEVPAGPVLCSDTEAPGTLLDAVMRGPLVPGPFPKWENTLLPKATGLPAVPVLATDDFLTATNATVGTLARVWLPGGRPLSVRITGRIAGVPGVSRDVPRLIVDSRVLAAQLAPTGQLLDREALWWVSVRGGDTGRALAAVEQHGYGKATDVAGAERELADDPLRQGARGALTLCLLLAPAFAVVAFTLHTALSARARQREFALLRALGVRRGQLAAYLWTEQLAIAAVAAVLGTFLGTALASVIMPLVTVDTGGGPVFPWLVTELPWGRIGLTVAATTLLICGVVTVAARFLARIDLARVLRAGEDR